MYEDMDDEEFLFAVGDDAPKWAAAFMERFGHRRDEIDEGLMIGWFANAIEHSSDVRRWRREDATHVDPVELRGALARGYCTPENSSKVVDPVLMEAMVAEIVALDRPQSKS